MAVGMCGPSAAMFFDRRVTRVNWPDELDLMNTECQDTFGVTVEVRRVSKSAINVETGQRAISQTLSRMVPAIRGEVRSVGFSPGGGRSQHVTEVSYEILCKDMVINPLDPDQNSFPPSPVRKGDLIIDPNLTIASSGSGDAKPQTMEVERVDLSVDRRFWMVTTRGSEKV